MSPIPKRLSRVLISGAMFVAPITASAVVMAPEAASASTAGEAALQYAKAQQGKPYRMGAEGPSSFDCSGLVQSAYRSAGVSLPRTTSAQAAAGQRIPMAQAQPGDIVAWGSGSGAYHVGLYAGEGNVVAARRTGTTIRTQKIWNYGLKPYVIRPA